MSFNDAFTDLKVPPGTKKTRHTPDFKEALSLKKRKINLPLILKYLSYGAIGLTLLSLIIIIGFILIKGVPHITWNFLTGKNTSASPAISGPIMSTLSLIFIALMIALPVGVAAALFLTEYAKRNSKVVGIIRVANDCLSGVPSIIFGLFGMIFFVGFLNLGVSLLAGGITLSLMILPTVIRSVEESLLSVPQMYREGSFALGAGKMHTTLKVVLPCSIRGIVTAAVLSVSRIVSESAVLIFTAGTTKDMIGGFSSQGASLAVAMYGFTGEARHFNEAYATAAVLIIIVCAVNFIAGIIENRSKNEN